MRDECSLSGSVGVWHAVQAPRQARGRWTPGRPQDFGWAVRLLQAARLTDDASGATAARPGLHRALVAARAGVMDVLLVYRVDRLTRSLRDLVTRLDDLDHAGENSRKRSNPEPRRGSGVIPMS